MVAPWIAIMVIWLSAAAMVAACAVWLPDFTFTGSNGGGFIMIVLAIVFAFWSTSKIVKSQ